MMAKLSKALPAREVPEPTRATRFGGHDRSSAGILSEGALPDIQDGLLSDSSSSKNSRMYFPCREFTEETNCIFRSSAKKKVTSKRNCNNPCNNPYGRTGTTICAQCSDSKKRVSQVREMVTSILVHLESRSQTPLCQMPQARSWLLRPPASQRKAVPGRFRPRKKRKP
jgi:hypothetical protein